MKKRSNQKKLIDTADRTLQDFYRRTYPKAKCECGCGRKAEVRHHHILKSQSNAGRFCEDNLIALSHFCHSKIAFGDTQIIARYSVKRGKEWLKKMDELKKVKRQAYRVQELKDIISKYE